MQKNVVKKFHKVDRTFKMLKTGRGTGRQQKQKISRIAMLCYTVVWTSVAITNYTDMFRCSSIYFEQMFSDEFVWITCVFWLAITFMNFVNDKFTIKVKCVAWNIVSNST